MKVKKIKSSKLIRNSVYAIVFMCIGAWGHSIIKPNIENMQGIQEPPYVITRGLEKGGEKRHRARQGIGIRGLGRTQESPSGNGGIGH